MPAEPCSLFSGDYLELPDGAVRYRLRGAERDPLLLLIGGLTSTMDLFDAAAAAFVAHGYRTLQFDLYGRGGSARPGALAYDLASYCRQVDALLAALGQHQPLFVLGQSLGGAIAASFAATRATRVRALSLHASAGYLARPPRTLALVRAPLIGACVLRLFGLPATLAGVERHVHDPVRLAPQVAELRRVIRQSAALAGYPQAVRRTLRRVRVENLEAEFRALGASAVPTQLVWGCADAVIPVDHAEILAGWLGGNTQLLTFEQVGHLPLLEAPERVLPAVLSFFASRSALLPPPA